MRSLEIFKDEQCSLSLARTKKRSLKTFEDEQCGLLLARAKEVKESPFQRNWNVNSKEKWANILIFGDLIANSF